MPSATQKARPIDTGAGPRTSASFCSCVSFGSRVATFSDSASEDASPSVPSASR